MFHEHYMEQPRLSYLGIVTWGHVTRETFLRLSSLGDPLLGSPRAVTFRRPKYPLLRGYLGPFSLVPGRMSSSGLVSNSYNR